MVNGNRGTIKYQLPSKTGLLDNPEEQLLHTATVGRYRSHGYLLRQLGLGKTSGAEKLQKMGFVEFLELRYGWNTPQPILRVRGMAVSG